MAYNGAKGKGKGKPNKNYGGDENWNSWLPGKGKAWTEQGEEAEQEDQERTGRILLRYQLPKVILRANAAEDGGCFTKDNTKKRMSDNNFLGQDHFMKIMTPSSSHIVRRPGIGL